MDKVKKILIALLSPHIAVMLILLPVAAVFLIYSMIFLETSSIAAVASYVLAFYTLTVWCLRLPRVIRSAKRLKTDNRYAKRWLEDVHLRMNVTLYGSLLWNTAYALFQLCLGLYHGSFWYYALAGYYICLATMRFFLVRHTGKHQPGEEMDAELKKYRTCGWIFLGMNLVLTVMIFFMVYWNRTFHHHEITTIAMAAYTFTTFTVAIINLVRYRKFNSPVYSASKAISLAAACVSMLTLESTMLTTFGGATMELSTRRLFLALTGGSISVFIITMALYMILHANHALKKQEYDHE